MRLGPYLPKSLKYLAGSDMLSRDELNAIKSHIGGEYLHNVVDSDNTFEALREHTFRVGRKKLTAEEIRQILKHPIVNQKELIASMRANLIISKHFLGHLQKLQTDSPGIEGLIEKRHRQIQIHESALRILNKIKPPQE